MHPVSAEAAPDQMLKHAQEPKTGAIATAVKGALVSDSFAAISRPTANGR